MGIGWKDGDAVGPAGVRDAHPQDGGIQRVSRDGEMRGGRNPEKMEPVGRTHVQRVLRHLCLRAAVEADEAHRLWRKERRHHQSRWRGAEGRPPPPQGPVMPGEGGSLVWDACPILSSSYLFGGEFDEGSFVPLQEKNKKRVFGGDPHDSAAPERGKPPASITRQPYSWGASGGHGAGEELAKAQHRCRDWPLLDFCSNAGCPIILSFVFEKSQCLSCRSGRAKRLDWCAANILLLLNGVQVNMQLKRQCNQSPQCHFPMVYCGGKGSETCFCE